MKNRLIACSIVLLSLLIYSCKDKSVFTLSGTINNPGSLKTVYLLALDSTRVSVVDSTNLGENGKFQFKHSSPYANFYKLRTGGTVFDLIAKNGDEITFTTDLNDNAHTYQVTGSDESEKIKEFNKLSNFYTEKNTKLSNDYQVKAQALGKQSDSLMKVFMPVFLKNMSEYGAATLKFVNDNRNSLAGFFAVASLDPDKYEQQMVAYADAIQGKFTDNPGVQQFIKQMMAIKPISVGHAAPDFTVIGFDDKPVKLADYKGKYVMLDFWASWCGPCRQENPNVVKAYSIYHPKGFDILGISLDTSKENWQQAITADKLSWTHASDLKSFEGATERLFHIEAIPSNFIIDPKGIIIAKNMRGAELEDFLNKTFNKPL